jgi:MoaA/NifB/PqqE/SkfB family radical SAM enzyme
MSSAENVELSIDEIDKISRSFGHIKVLTISGGEPFLRKDLDEIISLFYKNNKLQYVSFHTNAFLTDRIINIIARILRDFRALKVFVCVSIDGIGRKHNEFRGVEGGFDKMLQTIDRLKELKKRYKTLNLISSTIFSHSTENYFLETVQFIQNNLKGIKPSLGFIRGNAKDSSEKEVDIKKYVEFFDSFNYNPDRPINPFSPLALKESLEMLVHKIVIENYKSHRQMVPCQSGRKLVVIYENGDVYPCETLSAKFGNLRDVNYDISKLLFSERGKEIVSKIRKEGGCYCTWENIIPVNLLFSPAHYRRIVYEWLRLFFT